MTFDFELLKENKNARLGKINVNGREALTPLFMPVATSASVRTLQSEDIKSLGFDALICNAYHLMMRPGVEIIESAGGLHEFMNWDGIIFTDSGGFQMIRSGFSQNADDEGVTFKSEIDGKRYRITPIENIQIQKKLGSDVSMCLDYCPPYPPSEEELELSIKLTNRYAKECRKVGHNTFAISQGGIDPKKRKLSCYQLVNIGFDGYALGGLSIGEPKEDMYAMVEIADEVYPKKSPRYLMGLGSPVEMLECIGKGIDIFDSAYPTRGARHKMIFTTKGIISIEKGRYRNDHRALDPTCTCPTCESYSRAYINHLYKANEISWMRLTTCHNLYFISEMIQRSREAIRNNEFFEYKKDFISRYN